MSSFINGTLLLLAVLALVQLLIWAGKGWIHRQDEKRAREFRRVALFAEAQALGAAHQQRTQRNHRHFDRALWDRR